MRKESDLPKKIGGHRASNNNIRRSSYRKGHQLYILSSFDLVHALEVHDVARALEMRSSNGRERPQSSSFPKGFHNCGKIFSITTWPWENTVLSLVSHPSNQFDVKQGFEVFSVSGERWMEPNLANLEFDAHLSRPTVFCPSVKQRMTWWYGKVNTVEKETVISFVVSTYSVCFLVCADEISSSETESAKTVTIGTEAWENTRSKSHGTHAKKIKWFSCRVMDFAEFEFWIDTCVLGQMLRA